MSLSYLVFLLFSAGIYPLSHRLITNNVSLSLLSVLSQNGQTLHLNVSGKLESSYLAESDFAILSVSGRYDMICIIIISCEKLL